ncbi:phage head morphogenesis protein [Acinetobacter sp. ANC 3903]|uniref:phage head morphogenesis protein n=1 Tax=Acinetobacter sp. ANC 3903 TaxID=1977883 RepID=UPI000A338EF6|nr:phage minor head protein [Acinetobacter sp. ANC 3903]OTG62835.1 phage head morphogenesis protein [Acinetobacter sp. ANC 3903]
MQPVTFLEALQYAHSKKIVLPDEFYSMDLKTRQMATTVSFLSSLEQIETVIKAVNKSIADGGTFNDFQKLIAESEIILPKHYLDNVFRTNIQNAYGHGRWQQQQRNKAKRPYLMYSAINDSRVRPSHLALNRIVLPIDHPFWLTHYPPLGFRCRCTVIALTEKQALKYGITPDDQLPEVAEALDWSSHPLQFGELESLVDKKISASSLDKEYLLEQKEVIRAEWTASKKLTSLFAPMDDKSRDLFDTVANTVIPLDPQIRPSAIRTFLDYTQGNDAALTSYLSQPSISLADDVLKRWVKEDMANIQAVSANTSPVVTGSASLAYAASLEVGKVVTLDSPLLMTGSGSSIVIQIENAKGLGIDLEKLNAGQGVLFQMGLSFEVASVEMIEGKMVYLLKALNN